MRILFGPDNDGVHIAPEIPDGYEWWYFDAVSTDGRFALVAIFFLGAPMSPYYRQVVLGRRPLPRDWCGVFVTLHERVGARWKERAYAYNLYRDATFGESVRVGGSTMVRTPDGWQLTLDERRLWTGCVRASLTFTIVGRPPRHAAVGDEDSHAWVCVAPHCHVEGTVADVAFTGTGYHDHNFGHLPWKEVASWFWQRETHGSGAQIRYETHHEGGTVEAVRVGCGDDGTVQITRTDRAEGTWGSPDDILTASVFYERRADRNGVREVFRPRRMLGPLIRHFIWTRIRRRNAVPVSTVSRPEDYP
jgi:hypothetical protein